VEIFAGLSVCALVLVALFIATKTFALWRRTRGLPEFLLAGMLTCATVFGYPTAIVASRVSAAQLPAAHVATQVTFTLGYACLLLFTLNVFRPHALWAKGLVALTLLSLMAISAVYISEVLGEHPPSRPGMTGASVFTSIPIAVAYLWTMLESFAYYRRLRLQARLGLCDVVVANRVFLWGLMCLAAGSAVIVSNGAMLIQGALLSAGIVLVCSLLGLVYAGSLFFAFHPPDWYRAWLERESPAQA
jgi:hypothetical protein